MVSSSRSDGQAGLGEAVARDVTEAMPVEHDTRNCRTLAEALGRSGPHRLQYFLSHGR